jgi:hypothetical protein
MSDTHHLNALNSLIDTVKLSESEIQDIYQLLGKDEAETLMNEMQNFGKSIPENADEFEMLEWLKILSQKSPKTYDTLQRIIRENKKLFDKIQEIFIEKIL